MGIVIDVTIRDIEEGERADCYVCPVALAVGRATGEVAHVMGDDVLLEDLDLVADLPREARVWVRAYDANDEVPMPFSFTLPDLAKWAFDPDRGRDDDDEDS